MLRRIRARISRRPTGRSIPGWNRTRSPSERRRSAWQSSGVSERPPAAGSMSVPDGARTMKWPGIPMPRSRSPRRQPTSSSMTASVIGRPTPSLERLVELAVAHVVPLGGARPAEPAARGRGRRGGVASTTSGPSPRSRRIRTRSARSSSAATGASKSSSGRSSAAMHSAPTARSISGSGRATSLANRARFAARATSIRLIGAVYDRSEFDARRGPSARARPGAILTAPIPSPRLGNRSARRHRDRPARRARSHRPATGSCRHARRGPAPAGRRRIGRPVHGPARHRTSSPGSSAAARSASTTSSTSSTPRHLDWLFSRPVVVDQLLQLQANWMADYRNASGIVLDDEGPYGPTLTIEDSTRVDPWIVRQAERTAAARAGPPPRLQPPRSSDRRMTLEFGPPATTGWAAARVSGGPGRLRPEARPPAQLRTRAAVTSRQPGHVKSEGDRHDRHRLFRERPRRRRLGQGPPERSEGPLRRGRRRHQRLRAEPPSRRRRLELDQPALRRDPPRHREQR